MPACQPRPEQIEALARNHPEGDLHMLNMLKFREKAIHVHRDAGLEHQVLINCLDLPQSLARLQAEVGS